MFNHKSANTVQHKSSPPTTMDVGIQVDMSLATKAAININSMMMRHKNTKLMLNFLCTRESYIPENSDAWEEDIALDDGVKGHRFIGIISQVS